MNLSIIPIQSFSDIVTNSSSELFCIISGNEDVIKFGKWTENQEKSNENNGNGGVSTYNNMHFGIVGNYSDCIYWIFENMPGVGLDAWAGWPLILFEF